MDGFNTGLLPRSDVVDQSDIQRPQIAARFPAFADVTVHSELPAPTITDPVELARRELALLDLLPARRTGEHVFARYVRLLNKSPELSAAQNIDNAGGRYERELRHYTATLFGPRLALEARICTEILLDTTNVDNLRPFYPVLDDEASDYRRILQDVPQLARAQNTVVYDTLGNTRLVTHTATVNGKKKPVLMVTMQADIVADQTALFYPYTEPKAVQPQPAILRIEDARQEPLPLTFRHERPIFFRRTEKWWLTPFASRIEDKRQSDMAFHFKESKSMTSPGHKTANAISPVSQQSTRPQSDVLRLTDDRQSKLTLA